MFEKGENITLFSRIYQDFVIAAQTCKIPGKVRWFKSALIRATVSPQLTSCAAGSTVGCNMFSWVLRVQRPGKNNFLCKL